ncbi:MAG: hypothetical protein ACYS0D_00410 [Planctomycetota bacterium]|jgi:hypothetical protein
MMLDSSVIDDTGLLEDELEFWTRLEERRVVTTNDALHGLYLMADGDDPFVTYDQRLAQAHERGWIPQRSAPPANESAPVGLFAVASCDILEIRGGLTMRVLGPSGRYCTKELVFLEILPPRTEQQSLSGLEFIDLVGRIEDTSRRTDQ